MSRKQFSFPGVILMPIGPDPGAGPGSGTDSPDNPTSLIPWTEWQASHTVEGFDPRSCWDEYVSWWLTQGLDEDAFRAVNGGIGFADAPVVDVIPSETFPEL